MYNIFMMPENRTFYKSILANKSIGCFAKMCSLGKLSYLNMFSFKLRRKTTNETSLLLKFEAGQWTDSQFQKTKSFTLLIPKTAGFLKHPVQYNNNRHCGGSHIYYTVLLAKISVDTADVYMLRLV